MPGIFARARPLGSRVAPGSRDAASIEPAPGLHASGAMRALLVLPIVALTAACDARPRDTVRTDPVANPVGEAVGGAPTTIPESQILEPGRPKGMGGGPRALPDDEPGPNPRATEKPGGDAGLSGIYGSPEGKDPNVWPEARPR